jgi:hypothetical protein
MKALVNWVRSKLHMQDNRLPTELETMPLNALLAHYYSVLQIANVRINSSVPNCKDRKDFPCSFYAFLSRYIEKNHPVTVLDVGSHNCYLSFMISQVVHKNSRFDCVDVKREKSLYLSSVIKFHETDIFNFMNKTNQASYDYAILGAVLALFEEDRRVALLTFLRRCKYIFIREVPKITNLIDAYCEKDLIRYKGWNNYTELALKEELRKNGFEILDVEHEYDIYIYAQPR